MKKHFIYWLCAAVMLLALSVPAAATSPVEVDRPSSLALQYSQDGTAFPGLEIRAYRVAEIFPDGTYALWGDFKDYAVNIYGVTSQTEWRQITATLVSYITADQLQHTATATTDENGLATFSGLQTGMYLILSVTAEGQQTVVFEDFMISVPNVDANGEYVYDVAAKPKYRVLESDPGQREHRVTKLWKDAGFEESRPESVTVDIYKDGELFTTQSLSAQNDWSYSWTTEESDASVWTAVERDVAADYTVTIVTEGSTILITNAREGSDPPPDDTGDPILVIAMLMVTGGCGMGLTKAAARRKRNTDEEA